MTYVCYFSPRSHSAYTVIKTQQQKRKSCVVCVSVYERDEAMCLITFAVVHANHHREKRQSSHRTKVIRNHNKSCPFGRPLEKISNNDVVEWYSVPTRENTVFAECFI